MAVKDLLRSPRDIHRIVVHPVTVVKSALESLGGESLPPTLDTTTNCALRKKDYWRLVGIAHSGPPHLGMSKGKGCQKLKVVKVGPVTW